MLVARGVTMDMREQGILVCIERGYSDDELDSGKHLDVLLEYAPAE